MYELCYTHRIWITNNIWHLAAFTLRATAATHYAATTYASVRTKTVLLLSVTIIHIELRYKD